TVDHDHGALAGGVALQQSVEPFEVAVIEPLCLAVREPGAIDDAGVIQLVEVDSLTPADQAGDHAQVGPIAGGEDQGALLAEELGEGGLKLLVEVEGAVEEP